MKKITAIIFLFLIPVLATFINIPASHATDLTINNTTTEVYFSPHGGCTRAIVDQIDNAKLEILVQAYSFTSAPIAKDLINVHNRGVLVEIILDKSNRSKKYSAGDFTAHLGVTTYIDSSFYYVLSLRDRLIHNVKLAASIYV